MCDLRQLMFSGDTEDKVHQDLYNLESIPEILEKGVKKKGKDKEEKET